MTRNNQNTLQPVFTRLGYPVNSTSWSSEYNMSIQALDCIKDEWFPVTTILIKLLTEKLGFEILINPRSLKNYLIDASINKYGYVSYIKEVSFIPIDNIGFKNKKTGKDIFYDFETYEEIVEFMEDLKREILDYYYDGGKSLEALWKEKEEWDKFQEDYKYYEIIDGLIVNYEFKEGDLIYDIEEYIDEPPKDFNKAEKKVLKFLSDLDKEYNKFLKEVTSK